MSCVEKVIQNGEVVRRPCKGSDTTIKKESLNNGPGSELKKLLKKFGIVASAGCSCNSRAKIMDQKEASEPGWCEKNIDTIVGWLKEEAYKRKYPFFDTAAKLLIKKAIKNFQKTK